MRKTRIEVSNFKNAYININVGVLYLKLFMRVTVFCFVLLSSVVFEVFFMHVTVFCFVLLWSVVFEVF